MYWVRCGGLCGCCNLALQPCWPNQKTRKRTTCCVRPVRPFVKRTQKSLVPTTKLSTNYHQQELLGPKVEHFRVESSSKPRSFYDMKVDGNDVTYSCRGFQFCGNCQHACALWHWSRIRTCPMDTTEVTMGQFKKFLKSSGYDKYSPTDEHPMVFVSWHEGTFGNGVRIGMVVIRSTVFCGVVLGTTV